MIEKLKTSWENFKIFLTIFGSLIGVMFLILLVVGGAAMFGKGLQHDHERKLKQERIQFLRDSLQVEVLKKQINEQKN